MIKYPVIQKESISYHQLLNQNNILTNYNINEYLHILDHSYIYCNEDSFTYLGSTYIGKYSILQIVPNLYSKNNFNLFINWNDYNFARRNFFLRYFIIPSDHSLNDSISKKYALIYFENKYYYIDYPGANLELYRSKKDG